MRAIEFSGDAVRGILNTRPDVWPAEAIDSAYPHKWQTRRLAESWLRLRPGDALWVRERVGRPRGCQLAHYVEDGRTVMLAPDQPLPWEWKRSGLPARYMPKAACRLWLRVRRVWREPLQEIGCKGTRAEGAAVLGGPTTPESEFAPLWDSMHKTPGERWEDNPDVTVIEFERIRGGTLLRARLRRADMSLSKSGIDYLSHVWNPVVGCDRGCSYCWARRLARRIGKAIGCEFCERFTPHVHPERCADPTPKQTPKRIGLGFMSDLFGIGIAATLYPAFGGGAYGLKRLLSKLVEVMWRCPQHRFVIPTRCPEGIPRDIVWPDNVAILVTCTNQAEADERLPVALERVRGGMVIANFEPLMGPVTVAEEMLLGELRCSGCGYCPSHGAVRGDAHAIYYQADDPPALCGYYVERRAVDGIIVGEMSGPNARPMDLDWMRGIRDQCQAAGVPFYLKQVRGADGRMDHSGVLDGRAWRRLPEGLLLAGEGR